LDASVSAEAQADEASMDPNYAYFTDGGEPTTQSSVCAYFDVLGFTTQIRAAAQEGTSDELLRRFSSSVNVWYEALRDAFAAEYKEKRSWELKAFTDNVVMGRPIRHGGEPELGFVMTDLALLQLGLVLDGFFVRGGIAVGELFMDDDIVFGVALLDAYATESQADSPRIVLHPSARVAVEEHLTYYYSVANAPHDHALLQDEDGALFVNYLDALWQDKSGEPDLATLGRHRDVVIERLERFRSSPRIWSKYAWVARYHNYFCYEIEADEEYSIDPDNLALKASRLHEAYPERD
jgi:hypothetical protein